MAAPLLDDPNNNLRGFAMRTVFSALSVFSLTALLACGNSNTTPDASTNIPPDAGPSDAGCSGGGTVVNGGTGIALPAPYQSSNVSDFASSNAGGASAYLNSLVQLTATSTSVGGTPGGGCPSVFVYQTYCDGFNAVVSAGGDGGVVLVDDFDYLSNSTACQNQFNNATLTSVRGLWYDYYNSAATPKDNYSIALTACSDVTGTGGYTGTGTAPSTPTNSQTVHALRTGTGTDGSTQTVSGVVVAHWGPSSTGSFGFSIQDAAGGPTTGVAVTRSKTSCSQASVPNIGDYVTVTGAFHPSYAQIDL
jgi:hypothetical protein